MRRLNDEEIRAFLTAGTRTGKLAVTRLDGSPMVVPVWFCVDDDGTLLFTTWRDTIKAKAIRREPRVSLCVDEEQPPYAYVRVDGSAATIDDPQLLRSWAARIGGRYMGSERPPSTASATACRESCSSASRRRGSSLRPISPTEMPQRMPQLRAVFGHGAKPRVRYARSATTICSAGVHVSARPPWWREIMSRPYARMKPRSIWRPPQ